MKIGIMSSARITVPPICIHRGSHISAHILSNLLNELRLQGSQQVK